MMIATHKWLQIRIRRLPCNMRMPSSFLLPPPPPTPQAVPGMASTLLSRSLPAPPLLRPICLLFFSLFPFFLLALLLHRGADSVSRTKTIAGYNLEPTPWHPFPVADHVHANAPSTYGRILRCSYLSCTPNLFSASRLAGRGSDPPRSSTRPERCPFVFRWIREDLAPWAETGISAEDVAAAKERAAMRVVVVGGRLYVDLYYACVQSRAVFTVWGVLQLLRRYPGEVPDVDLMFDCMDRPVVERSEVQRRPPPPLFRYSTSPRHYDIPFPDWSFWGWPEVNIGPWDEEFADIKRGAMAQNWSSKLPLAYWKGNPDVDSPVRTELLKCNDSQAWGAQIMRQDWGEESRAGFQQSKLSSQCGHRYKIYAEGYAWSVSLKYILACGSMSLIIDPEYQDFFSRGLKPKHDYWPVRRQDLCSSIKSAVEWGSNHSDEAAAIGKGGQDYMAELSMEHVYDYMYHIFREYHKLQRFKPEKPPSAQEICDDYILCYADDKQKSFLKRSSASPSSSRPCTLPP